MINSISTVSNYFLCGFTGCGKSSIGAHLAKITRMTFVDLDEMMSQHARKPVYVLFGEYGENKYRNLEADILRQQVQEKGQIIALGAGTIIVPFIREIIQKSGIVIFLDLPFETLYERIRTSEKRFLFHQPTDTLPLDDSVLYKRVQACYQVRRPYYQTSDIVIQIKDLNCDQIVEKMFHSLQNFKSFQTETS